MRRTSTVVLAAALATTFATPPVAADEASDAPATLIEAFAGGTYHLGLRYRFEDVDEDARDEGAHASTLRTTLSYESAPFHGVTVFLELEDVTDVGTNDQYANRGAGSLGNGVTDRPVIADPDLTEVNQASLRLALPAGTRIEVGRQEVNLGDQRFVGAVGWRQNHQSFDAARITGSPRDGIVLTYAYLEEVHRIFGDSQPMASHLLDARFAAGPGTVAVYGYLLDYDEPTASGLSTATYGANYSGRAAVSDGMSLAWHGEYAIQRDAGDNPAEIDADYLRAQLDASFGGWSAGGGYELLGADQGRFTTPLATLHKWNGFADKFLATPPDGLRDLWITGGFAADRWKASLAHHWFDADRGGSTFGSELDFVATYRAPWGSTLGLKGAFYSADDFSSDTRKLALWCAHTF